MYFAAEGDYGFRVASHEHTYSYKCDTICRGCGEERENPHIYANECDATCNVCGATRIVLAHKGGMATCKAKAVCNVCGALYGSLAAHTYSNACDKECNACKATRTITHDYTAATCIKAKTCKVCGATSGSTLGHKYTNDCDTSCNTCKATRSTTHSYKPTSTKATLSQNGKTVTKCTVCGTVKSTAAIYYPKSIKLSATTYTYNGKTKTPSVTVKDSKGKTLKKGTDYTVTYPKKRKSIGKYTVTVTFKGNYRGTKKLTFEIVPAKVTLSKLTAGSKRLTATWKTVSGSTGYEVVYSTSKKFTKKTTKTVTIKKSKTKKTTIKKLKKGKKYYVKVRAYKTVSGKKICGAYSSVKNVKVK